MAPQLWAALIPKKVIYGEPIEKVFSKVPEQDYFDFGFKIIKSEKRLSQDFKRSVS